MAELLTAEEYRIHIRELGRVRQQRYRSNHGLSGKSKKGTKEMADQSRNDLPGDE